MRHNKAMDFGTGLFVFLGILAIFFLVTQTTGMRGLGAGDGYEVTARFDDIGNLRTRAPVTMAGVRLGRVTDIEFDGDRLDAVVTMTINDRYDNLPADTTASIRTSGLLGEQFIALEPGGDVEALAQGDQIIHTQSALVLENLIGQFLYSQGE
ncbi:phospholipid/cholesterol/gamma-HCH transport system substrate-binding protein [Natronospira proteinivora]|uniref:Phospholipid/cholesterol/gamma-HCH transport system substrate-binding protein n=1 Tax=Natronospira proteinivora TaxID=1807133 RepID=A0ABT1G5A8_9GAMM|nr:outer membrane lipid asymmetry maintenance protein MlaD [Natronospira proteinivora]MCP1726474.1 phospholipid/cholesterol/gamma-HCH transport system substrate-binding protein [Natronospira proteinivora]